MKQALLTNPEELRKIADKLEKEYQEHNPSLGNNIVSIVYIVNKSGDGWAFEATEE